MDCRFELLYCFAGLFASFLWEKVPRGILKEDLWQTLQICATDIPDTSADYPGQTMF